MATSQPSVGIAGAGLMGRLLGLHLRDAGYRVTLFDADTAAGTGACAWVAGGMLAPYTELEKAEPLICALGLESLALWPNLLARLPRPVFFQRAGTLVVAHRQDMGDLEAFRAAVAARLPAQPAMQALDAAAVADLEPELAGRFGRGIYFPEEGQMEPRDLLPALGDALRARGAIWHEGTSVRQVAPGALQTDTGTHRFDLVADTRGLGARPHHPLRGVRGEVMRFHAPDVGLRRMVRLMHPRYPLYIVPRPDNVYLIGATTIESDADGPVTVRSALELLSAVYSLHPGFAEAAVLSQEVGRRPAYADNLPRIRYEPGLLSVNGLYRHGFLISPALAREACNLVSGGAPRHPDICEVAHATT